ncbi:Ada metal-binding domain-containing protein [Persephonella sp.]
MWLGVLCLVYFLPAFAQERVIIENKGSHYHIEVYKEPEYRAPKNVKPNKKKYRKGKHRKKEKYYVAKENGKVFHRPSCRFAKKIKHKVRFKTKRKAKNAGLRPCKVCKP